MTDFQKKWDEQLIGCWRADLSMPVLYARFFDSIGQAPESDIEKMVLIMESLGIRRWRNNKATAIKLISPVRAFVHSHSKHLNDCLLCNGSKGNTDEDIMNAIDYLEWSNPAQYRKKGRPKKTRRKSVGANIRLRFREIDKKHDWSTIK